MTALANLAPLMSSEDMTWQTPEELLDLVRELGPIALDPCTSPENPVGAKLFYTEADNGLAQDWQDIPREIPGLIYVNPPYGRALATWAPRIARAGSFAWGAREVVALVPARTDTRWFRALVDADALAFWYGRLTFRGAPAPAPFPSVVAYWGGRRERFREVFAPRAWVVLP